MAAITAVQNTSVPFDSIGISEDGRTYVIRAIEAGPTRNVSDGVSNVTGFAPIPWLGESIPFESKNVEAVFVATLAFDETVVQIIAQPAPIKIEWVTIDGKKRSTWHRADYLVICTDRILLVECKDEDKLEELEQKAPDRFRRDKKGHWISPAGARAVSSWGIQYQVFCPSHADKILMRNIDFVWDHFWPTLTPLQIASVEPVKRVLAERKHIQLKELLRMVSDVDAVHLAIARKQVSFRWQHHLLRSPETAMVYVNDTVRDALSAAPINAQLPELKPTSIEVGDHLRWIHQEWSVLSIRDTTVTMVNTEHRVAELSLDEITHAVGEGELVIHDNPSREQDQEATEILKKCHPNQLTKAYERFEQLRNWQRGELTSLADRTARDWKKRVADAEIRYGIPILGLIDRNNDKGNRNSYVDPFSKQLALESINEDYCTEAARSGVFAFKKYQSKCKAKQVQPLCYSTYMRYVKKGDVNKRNRKRHGQRFAYQHCGPISQGVPALPVNGDRAWGVAHIDHTPVDLELVSAITGENLGQPWLTLMIDAWSRVVLGYYLSYYSPSRVALMMVVRDCVRRWNRLPNKLVVDRGPDFRSVYFDKLTSGYNSGKLLRPTGEGRFGSPGERIFGTANTSLFHQLTGNTKNRVLRRGLSSTHDPAKFAIWTPDAFAELFEHWAFDVYPVTKHRGIGEKPRDRYQRSLRDHGDRGLVRIPYNDSFLFSTLPEAPHSPTRKVGKGVVTIDHLEYRGLNDSINPYNGQTGQVRIAPNDPSRAWIFLDKEWRELVCTHDLMREYMERAVQYSHLEISARLSKAGKRIGEIDDTVIDLINRISETEVQLKQRKEELTAPTPELSATNHSPPVSDLTPSTTMKVRTLNEEIA